MSSLYTTVQGDAWDMIAYREMGSEKYMDSLIEANPSHRETVFFSAGTVLVIPDADESISTDEVPPWQA